MEEHDIAVAIYIILSIIGGIMALKIRHMRNKRKAMATQYAKEHMSVIDDKKNMGK